MNSIAEQDRSLYVKVRSLFLEGLTLAKIQEKAKTSLYKIKKWTEDLRQKGKARSRDRTDAAELVRSNPDITLEELDAQFPTLSREVIRRATHTARRRTRMNVYVDPGTKIKYHSVVGIAQQLGLEEAAINVAITAHAKSGRTLPYILVLNTKSGKLLRHFRLEDFFTALPRYLRRHKVVQAANQPFDNWLNQKPDSLDLAEWVVLLALLLNKNARDRWLMDKEIHRQLVKTYDYKKITIHNAVQGLIRNGYIIPRDQNWKDVRSFWATGKCPMDLISVTEKLENGQLVRIYRDYVKVDARVVKVASTIMDHLDQRSDFY